VSDLATSTYTPLIEEILSGAVQKLNVTSLPGAVPTPTLTTLLLTDASGAVRTTLSPLPVSTVVLGHPPGYSAGETLRPYGIKAIILVIVSTFFLTFYGVSL
jgi:hypothetical protein